MSPASTIILTATALITYISYLAAALLNLISCLSDWLILLFFISWLFTVMLSLYFIRKGSFQYGSISLINMFGIVILGHIGLTNNLANYGFVVTHEPLQKYLKTCSTVDFVEDTKAHKISSCGSFSSLFGLSAINIVYDDSDEVALPFRLRSKSWTDAANKLADQYIEPHYFDVPAKAIAHHFFVIHSAS